MHLRVYKRPAAAKSAAACKPSNWQRNTGAPQFLLSINLTALWEHSFRSSHGFFLQAEQLGRRTVCQLQRFIMHAAIKGSGAPPPVGCRGLLPARRRAAPKYRNHRIFSVEAQETPCDQHDLDHLSSACRLAAGQRSLRRGKDGVTWSNAPSMSMTAIADRIAPLAADLLISRQQRRAVRICQGRNCGLPFRVQSRGGHRRWCSDRTFGSAARVRKSRAERVDYEPRQSLAAKAVGRFTDYIRSTTTESALRKLGASQTASMLFPSGSSTKAA